METKRGPQLDKIELFLNRDLPFWFKEIFKTEFVLKMYPV